MTRFRPGPLACLSAVDGLTIGHAADATRRTDTTVIRCGELYTAPADVRGGGPGTRETHALRPENLVGGVHAIALSG